ncbi:hypothetical protein SGLAM104S_08328 [Streptomyces glaucescens]
MFSAAMEDAVRNTTVWSPSARREPAEGAKPMSASRASGAMSPTTPRTAARTPNTAMVQPDGERGRIAQVLRE